MNRQHSAATAPQAPPSLAWGLWFLAGAFYLLAFFHRVAPAVITRELMAGFDISAAALGNLSGLYFYSYVAMQIPTGLLADAWGPRKLLSTGAAMAGLGGFLFALSPAYAVAGFGRLLVGAGVAVAYVCLIKLADNWLPPKRFALCAGLALMIGISGAVGAGAPLRFLVDALGWRPAMAWAAGVTLAAACAIWLFVRDDPTQKGYRGREDRPTGAGRRLSLASMLGDLKIITTRRNNWLLFLAPGGLVGPVTTFAGLWGVTYLRVLYGLDETTAGLLCSGMLVCWALGGTFLGWLSDRVGLRKPLYLAGCVTAFVGWAGIIFLQGLPFYGFVVFAILAGLGTGGMSLSFAFGKESSPARLAGSVAGFMNMGIMSGPALLQPAVGLILDMLWDGRMVDGARAYSLSAYQAGFSIMMIWSLAAVVFIAMTKETYGRQLEE